MLETPVGAFQVMPGQDIDIIVDNDIPVSVKDEVGQHVVREEKISKSKVLSINNSNRAFSTIQPTRSAVSIHRSGGQQMSGHQAAILAAGYAAYAALEQNLKSGAAAPSQIRSTPVVDRVQEVANEAAVAPAAAPATFQPTQQPSYAQQPAYTFVQPQQQYGQPRMHAQQQLYAQQQQIYAQQQQQQSYAQQQQQQSYAQQQQQQSYAQQQQQQLYAQQQQQQSYAQQQQQQLYHQLMNQIKVQSSRELPPVHPPKSVSLSMSMGSDRPTFDLADKLFTGANGEQGEVLFYMKQNRV
eukprot:GHVP01068581.1.p1 GENE.GHVP01068581.1~~GHVP01068581.1.p1  ORF type:complete len:297 (+),score=55.03 GHVP01068581.1:142-1032(+)